MTVYEAVPEVTELGVGINLSPHALAVLDRVGLAERLGHAALNARQYIAWGRKLSDSVAIDAYLLPEH